MIIYKKDFPPLLSDYGIEVPMLKARTEKIYDKILKKFGADVFSHQSSPTLTDEDFLRVHTPDYLRKSIQDPKNVAIETFELVDSEGDFHRFRPDKAKKELSGLVPLFKRSCEDTYLCLLEAQKKGFSYYLGGGYHHALSNQGRGFCMFNDIMIAAKKFQEEREKRPIWVIDIDAHKGCGTAALSHYDKSVQTLSIHMKSGWPLDTEKYDKNGKIYPWFLPSTVDVEIPRGGEENYLVDLQKGLIEFDRMTYNHPALCIVVDGSDPFEGDVLASSSHLQLSRQACFERNLVVYHFLKQKNIPQAYLMSGGYGEQNWMIHYQFIEYVLSEIY